MQDFLDGNLENRETGHSLMSGSHNTHGLLEVMPSGLDEVV